MFIMYSTLYVLQSNHDNSVFLTITLNDILYSLYTVINAILLHVVQYVNLIIYKDDETEYILYWRMALTNFSSTLQNTVL